MEQILFDKLLEPVQAKERRYRSHAYRFVRESLDSIQSAVARSRPGRMRHVTGQEMLDGVRQAALTQFGPMAMTVLQEWGIRSCRDLGEIIVNMAGTGLLSSPEDDPRAAFETGFDFWEAFCKPFLPQSKRASGHSPNPAPE